MAKTTITKQCEICGGDYQTPPCYARKRRTCSRECMAELRRRTGGQPGGRTIEAPCAHCGTPLRKRYGPSDRVPDNVYCNADCQRAGRAAPMVTLTCVRCGSTFQRLAHRQRQRGKRGPYCSRKCLDEHAKRTCDTCGEQFQVKHGGLAGRPNRYCSIACMRVGLAKPVIRCEQCSKEFSAPNATSRFCTRACYADWLSESGVMSGEQSINWKGGRSWSNRFRGPNWRQQRRKALRRDGNRCQKCGVARDEVRRLVVHHIVPFAQYGGDYEAANQLGNLLTLCDPCHTTHEWRLTKGERLF